MRDGSTFRSCSICLAVKLETAMMRSLRSAALGGLSGEAGFEVGRGVVAGHHAKRSWKVETVRFDLASTR